MQTATEMEQNSEENNSEEEFVFLVVFFQSAAAAAKNLALAFVEQESGINRIFFSPLP